MSNENELKIVNIDDLAIDTANNMPGKTEPVNAENVNAESPVNVKPVNKFNSLRDKSGNTFNPDIHKLDANGKPKLNRKGNFTLKGKGRKEGGSVNENVNTETETESEHLQSDIPESKIAEDLGSGEQAQERDLGEGGQNSIDKKGAYIPDEYDHAAHLYFHTGTAVMAGALSDEWLAENDGEAQSVIKPLAAYLRAKGEIDLTPGQLTALALVAYAGKRVNKPNTKQRLAILYVKVKGWFKKS